MRIDALLTFGARHRLITLAILILLTAIAIPGVVQLRVDTGYESFMSSHDPTLPDYQRTIEEFGSDNATMIYLESDQLFSPARLRQIETLVSTLSNLEAVERVDSLFNAANVRDEEGSLESGPLMTAAPDDLGEAAEIREKALHNPLIRGQLVSPDGRVTAVTVTVRRERKTPEFNWKFFETIERELQPLRKDFQRVYQIGPPRLNVEIAKGMGTDLARLTPLGVCVLMATIVVFLRTPVGAVVPLATAGLSVLWTIGFMGYVGLPMTLLTAIIPSLALVIGSTEDVHMLAEYLQVSGEVGDRRKAVQIMAKRLGLPLIINSCTTVLGFLANALTDIRMIQGFAYASSFNMLVNTIATVLVVPLFVSTMAPKTGRLTESSSHPAGLIGVITRKLARVRARHGRIIATMTVLVIIGFGYLSSKVAISNDPISYFKPGHPIVEDAHRLHDTLCGMNVFFLTLEAREAGAFKDPELLKKVEHIQRLVQQAGFDRATTVTDFLALVNREMNQGDPAFFRVPDTQNLVEQYLLFFQRGDLERYVSADYRIANIVVRHNLSSSEVLNRKLDGLAKALPGILGDRIAFRMTSELLMINRAAESMFTGELQSLTWLLIVIFIIQSLMFTSAIAGFLSLVPNIIPIVINFGTMTLLGIPLNPGTVMVAAISIGIAVDDTVHLMSRYNAECHKDGNQERALEQAVAEEALPVIVVAVALALGFVILQASQFSVVAQFGFLSAMTMVTGMISELLITPLILKPVRLVGIWEIVGLKIDRTVLTKSPLFRGMTPYQIKKTILLSQVSTLAQGHDILIQGTRGRSLYVVLAGTVEVARHEQGRVERLATLGPGEIFGEVGYSQEIERTATVKALGDTTVLELNFDRVQQSLRWYPGIAAKLNLNISRILGERLAETDARMARLELKHART